MVLLTESARAKVNLTLKVLGKRADGYHELVSLVAFAGEDDRLELTPGDEVSLRVEGPFAGALEGGGNLVLEAARLVAERCSDVQAGAFRLDKRLPVGAGLGGGSADAAAALRLIAQANPGRIKPEAMNGIAGQLGADVGICLESRPALMLGRGDDLKPVPDLPFLPAVLANPGVSLGAEEVYSALQAEPLESRSAANEANPLVFASVEGVAGHIRETGNDLEATATKLVPVIADVRAALAALEECQVAQMSGSGPACFGLFANERQAASARDRLRAAHPDWWVVSTTLS